MQYAHARVHGEQWRCLRKLWIQESRWRRQAVNRKTDAVGIPQGEHPPYGVKNYRAQIQWGLGYIRGRYGSPCNAWNHEVANGWY